MLTAAELQEYLAEIRQQVCAHCVERPPEGPPCYPHGKVCGIELHLPHLIEAIQDIRSGWIRPYLDHNRDVICGECAFQRSSCCPCPMDELIYLVVNAVETVDERRAERQQEPPCVGDMTVNEPEIEAIEQCYREATGQWTGCDWPMKIGPSGLDVEGMTAAQARARVVEGGGQEWDLAATWLTRVEGYAREAERQAAAALAAARDGNWPVAARHAEKAWALEFCTGRMIRGKRGVTWNAFHQMMQEAFRVHGAAVIMP